MLNAAKKEQGVGVLHYPTTTDDSEAKSVPEIPSFSLKQRSLYPLLVVSVSNKNYRDFLILL